LLHGELAPVHTVFGAALSILHILVECPQYNEDHLTFHLHGTLGDMLGVICHSLSNVLACQSNFMVMVFCSFRVLSIHVSSTKPQKSILLFFRTTFSVYHKFHHMAHLQPGRLTILSDYFGFCHCILTSAHWQAFVQLDIFVIVNFNIVIAV
jgi:hypothetical protein